MRIFIKYDENQVLILLNAVEAILTCECGVDVCNLVDTNSLLYSWYEKICDACDNNAPLMIPFNDIENMRNELVSKYGCDNKDVNTCFCLSQNMKLHQEYYKDTSVIDSDREVVMVYDASEYGIAYVTDDFPVFSTISNNLFDKFFVSIEPTSPYKFREMQVILAFHDKHLEKIVSDSIIFNDCIYEPEDVELNPFNEVFVCIPKSGKNNSEVTKMSNLDFYRIILISK